VTSPIPFAIAAPPMIGPLPATIVCYILYGLGAFLPIAFIVIVAIVLSCRRRVIKSDFVAASEISGFGKPEARKNEIQQRGISLGSPIFISATPHIATLPAPGATLSADNPNVYFRQPNKNALHAKSAENGLLGNDSSELGSGSTASGRTSDHSSASRSTLQIRRQSDDHSAGSVKSGFDETNYDDEGDPWRRKAESDDTDDGMLKPEVVKAWIEETPTNWTKRINDITIRAPRHAAIGVDRPGEELPCEIDHQEQEQALRYILRAIVMTERTTCVILLNQLSSIEDNLSMPDARKHRAES